MESVLGNFDLFNKASKNIVEKANNLVEKEAFYFAKGDKYLSDYVNSLRELRKAMADYNNLFYDLEMSIEQSEFEQWEREQALIEQEYYSEVI